MSTGSRDLDRPEHLFQLVVGGLPADFPALTSLAPGSARADGLPPSPNRTIGRADDVRAIVDRLRVDGVRLLTLTGPGRVGQDPPWAGGGAHGDGGLRGRCVFRYGQQQDAIEARLDADLFATARSRHGADVWDAAVRSGPELSFEDAIACALDQQCAGFAHTASTT